MNKKNILMGLALVVSIALWSPSAILAGEHGGKEHGGSEHGGAKMEGSHGMMADHAGTLKEAARVLKEEGHMELAAEVEAIAKMKEEM
ncbi:MAG: hypothetical protein COV74_05975 [Candidatus Omnitrophica bacterium CG11_big_fil_rev_8_21_14_0_20_45_26]|uniref:Metal-binding protein SmbP n=1 Tax=Candidatus Abzuiibacterium crystallinum TaxID=1974748 RepID=A0A2H0LP16_9BACT|nr:MAG: hypothetical protein COV74_05975 [Candidatus Omnitrophica bacterium CG11_big_fil_rev_8_21_14_0_20_45_26]PIW65299.1 MAG: hypothetical protein COW12_02480 [Candidatus Omnitrophica bacterium CG12_big_fil_rev_8_21_14_0_65_45_16]